MQIDTIIAHVTKIATFNRNAFASVAEVNSVCHGRKQTFVFHVGEASPALNSTISEDIATLTVVTTECHARRS